MSASVSHRLFEDYVKNYVQFQPDLAVINLSNNDPPDAFEKGITDFLELNQSRKIKTLLLEEANSGEVIPVQGSLLANHRTLRQLAARFGVPIYSLHEFLNRPEVLRSGFLWWDFVHLTSYGQALTAQWLSPKLLKFVNP